MRQVVDRYLRAIAARDPVAEIAAMKKRILAGLLWFYVAWFAWAFVAAYAGLSELWGPVLGAAVAMLIAGDPMGRIWPRPAEIRPMAPAGVPASEPA